MFSLSRVNVWLFSTLLLLGLPGFAQDNDENEQRYVVDVELQSVTDFRQLLERAEHLLVEGQLPSGNEAAITFVLHGPVVRNLLRKNYLDNKKTADLAASLSALGVVDIKACRTWLGENRVSEAELLPFIETVSYGPGEVQRLVREGNYLYF